MMLAHHGTLDKLNWKMEVSTTKVTMNPDELLNQDVKANVAGRKRAKNLAELKSNLRSYLFGTQKNPEIVKDYFQKKEVAYAA